MSPWIHEEIGKRFLLLSERVYTKEKGTNITLWTRWLIMYWSFQTIFKKKVRLKIFLTLYAVYYKRGFS